MICLALVVALMSVWMTACAKEESSGDTYEKYTSIAANTDGIIVIPTEGITSAARFFNYDANGVTVQLVALRDKENGVHIAFNTCQSCSPSPKAYYTQNGTCSSAPTVVSPSSRRKSASRKAAVIRGRSSACQSEKQRLHSLLHPSKE